MKRLLLISLLVLFTGFGLKAQQRMQYSQYLLNGYFANPAAAGMEDHMDLKTSYRYQWVGFDGAPQGLYATFHTPFLSKGNKKSKSLYQPVPVRGRGDELVLQADTSEVEEIGPLEVSMAPRSAFGLNLFSETAGAVRQKMWLVGLRMSRLIGESITPPPVETISPCCWANVRAVSCSSWRK